MAPRITEGQIRTAALQLLSDAPGSYLSTTKLIAELEGIFQPEGTDAAILDGRSDTYFSQKVRNLVSHRSSHTSLVSRGYAEYDEVRQGFTITEAGRLYLESLEN